MSLLLAEMLSLIKLTIFYTPAIYPHFIMLLWPFSRVSLISGNICDKFGILFRIFLELKGTQAVFIWPLHTFSPSRLLLLFCWNHFFEKRPVFDLQFTHFCQVKKLLNTEYPRNFYSIGFFSSALNPTLVGFSSNYFSLEGIREFFCTIGSCDAAQ